MPAPSEDARRSAAPCALTAMIHGRRTPWTRADLARRLEAVEPGHLEVHEDHVVEAAPPRLDDRGPVGHGADPVAEALEQALRDLPVDRVVVGDQDLQRSIARRRRPAARSRALPGAARPRSGTSSVNVAPSPGTLAPRTQPPIRSASRVLMARPRPVPP